jgi:glycosyltransferase involved in cell wall biosynthesis
MNVLLVAPHFPPSHVGGVEVHTKALADGLTASGHRVEVAAVEELTGGERDGCVATIDRQHGYPVHRLTLTLAPGRTFPLLWEHPAAEEWCMTTVTRFAPAVVHVHSGYLLGAPALAAARRAGVSSVVTLHDYWFACPRITLVQPGGARCSGPETAGKCAWCLASDQRRIRWLPGPMRDRLAARARKSPAPRWLDAQSRVVAARQRGVLDALAGAAAVLSPTRFVADAVAAAGFATRPITVQPVGHPRTEWIARRPDANHVRLAYLGQIAPHKGVHLAIDAVRANRDPRLTLAVHGPLTPHEDYVTELRRRAAGDPRIVFHGPYRRADLPAIFSVTDALLVPSTWYENAPLVIYEAHAAGVPVVASRLGGIPELVTNERDGLLFEPDQADDLGRQIERLLTEPDLLARLGAGARAPRTIDDDVQGLVRLYERVSGGVEPRRAS